MNKPSDSASTTTSPIQTPTKHIRLTRDRIVSLILLAIIVAMVIVWRPWEGRFDAHSRTINVSGEATVKATPDEYVFYPSYSFKNTDRPAALAALEEKSAEVTAGLKKLGVADSAIASNSSGYDGGGISLDDTIRFQRPSPSDSSIYTLQITVTIGTRDLAQKVQDYLVTTAPTGSVSPQANFSDKKRKELESRARDEATKEARAKADQSARNLGFAIGPVKSVEDGTGFGVFPLSKSDYAEDSATTSDRGLQIQPGENELSYSVAVTYYLR